MEHRVKVLGTGCMKCKSLLKNTQEAMTNLGLHGEAEMVTNINDIISYGVAVTPALVIDDMVWSSGEVPTTDEIKEIFRKQDSISRVEG